MASRPASGKKQQQEAPSPSCLPCMFGIEVFRAVYMNSIPIDATRKACHDLLERANDALRTADAALEQRQCSQDPQLRPSTW